LGSPGGEHHRKVDQGYCNTADSAGGTIVVASALPAPGREEVMTMDRRKHLRGVPAASNDCAATPQARRAVLDNTRRKVERALAVEDTAEELAKSAQDVLNAADADQIVVGSEALSALRAALARYRKLHDAHDS
jgi:hypothetical protein